MSNLFTMNEITRDTAALVEAFSVIVKTDGSFAALVTLDLVTPGRRGTRRPGTPRPCRGNTGNTARGAPGPAPPASGPGELAAFCHFTIVQL